MNEIMKSFEHRRDGNGNIVETWGIHASPENGTMRIGRYERKLWIASMAVVCVFAVMVLALSISIGHGNALAGKLDDATALYQSLSETGTGVQSLSGTGTLVQSQIETKTGTQSLSGTGTGVQAQTGAETGMQTHNKYKSQILNMLQNRAKRAGQIRKNLGVKQNEDLILVGSDGQYGEDLILVGSDNQNGGDLILVGSEGEEDLKYCNYCFEGDGWQVTFSQWLPWF